MTQPFLTLKNITKYFDDIKVIDNLNLSLERGKMITLLGPSGCGKTTVLRLISGLDTPTSGQIFIEGKEITRQAIQQRDICVVFQSYALFPHLSIAENVGYGLKMQGVPYIERQRRIKDALSLVDLDGFEHRFIDQLSGGQQQRVALARALILKPKILLFDEPLSNLDANLRRSMRKKIRELQQQLQMTALYVTHDQNEAFAVSDHIIVMNNGVIQQQGTAQQLYFQPNSLFLANFMGESTILRAKRVHNQIHIGGYSFTLENAAQFNVPNGECLIGIRPEALCLEEDGSENQRCRITQAVYMGSHWEVLLEWQGQSVTAHIRPQQYEPNRFVHYLHFSQTGIFLLPDHQHDDD